MAIKHVRQFVISAPFDGRVVSVKETTDGNVTRIELADVQPPPAKRVFARASGGCALCTCDIPIKVSYKDVLILEQFMREDGTVLPKELTGAFFNSSICIANVSFQVSAKSSSYVSSDV